MLHSDLDALTLCQHEANHKTIRECLDAKSLQSIFDHNAPMTALINQYLAFDDIDLQELLSTDLDELYADHERYAVTELPKSKKETIIYATIALIYMAAIDETPSPVDEISQEIVKRWPEIQQAMNPTVSPQPQRKRQVIRWRRPAIIAAVLVVLLIVANLSVEQAYGFNFFQWLFRINEEEIIVDRPVSGVMEFPAEYTGDYRSLADALEQNGFGGASSYVPNWIPEFLAIDDVNVHQYGYGDNEMFIIADYVYDETSFMQIEAIYKSDYKFGTEKDIEYRPYEVGGRIHLIAGNNDTRLAIWEVGDFTFVISGLVTEDELEAMIDSIYER